MRRILPLGVLVFTACVTTTGSTTADYKLHLRPYELVGTDFPLPSGLRVFFQHDDSQPSVIVAATVGVGTTSDPEGMEGMAHLMEHLCFRARHEEKGATVWEELQLVGGIGNAFTTPDDTTYFTLAPKEALKSLLELEANRMLDPLAGVTDEILKVEREVVRNELRQNYQNSEIAQAPLVMGEMLFPEGHPYHRPGIGTDESLSNITMEAVRKFAKDHYRPENVTIVVAGDFDPKEAGKLLAETFPRQLMAPPGSLEGDIGVVEPKPRIAKEAPLPPPPADQTLRRIPGGVVSPVVLLGWSAPGGFHGKDAMLQAVARNMSYAISALLNPRSMWEKEQVEGLGCYASPALHATEVTCFIAPTEDQDPEVIARRALDGLWEQWDQATWRSRERGLGFARAGMMAQSFMSSASLFRAVDIVRELHFTGHPDVFSRQILELTNFDELEVREFAFKYLNRERAVAVIVEPWPEDEEKTIDLDASADWAGATRETSPLLDAAFEKMTDADILAVTTAPPLSGFKEFTLTNGLRVVIKRHSKTPFLKTALVTGGGHLTVSPYFATRYLRVRRDTRDPLEVAGSFGGFTGMDYDVTTVQTPSGNLDEALDLLGDFAETAKVEFDREVLQKQLEWLERELKMEARKPSSVMYQAAGKALLGDHPLAAQRPDPAQMKNLNLEQLDRILYQMLAPANATLIVVGDVDPAAAEQKIRARWAAWRATDRGGLVARLPGNPKAPTRKLLLVDRPESSQSELLVQCLVAPGTTENQPAAEVASKLLEDDLWNAIRIGAGASYGVSVSISDWPGGASTMFVHSNIENENLPGALGKVLERIAAVSEGKVEKKMLNRARWKLAQRSHARYLGLDGMLGAMVAEARYRNGMSELSAYPGRLSRVNVEAVSERLGSCAGHEVIGVTGPAKALRPALEKLGIPIEVIEVEKAPAEEKAQASLAR